MNVQEFVEAKARTIAEYTGIIETSLSKYFNGHRDPSYTTIQVISEKLNMTPGQVIQGIQRKREKKTYLSNLTSKKEIA